MRLPNRLDLNASIPQSREYFETAIDPVALALAGEAKRKPPFAQRQVTLSFQAFFTGVAIQPVG